MSELMNNSARNNGLRRQLLTTVSALSLLGAALDAGRAMAADDDADRPTIWIELGPQIESGSDLQRFSPPFFSRIDTSQLTSPLTFERPSAFSFGGEGKIAFQPEGSPWVFSAGVRYGRAVSRRHVHEQYDFPPITPNATGYNIIVKGPGGHRYAVPLTPNVEETATIIRESHTIVDFQVGKDIGIGMFGNENPSTFSLGVRLAEFSNSAGGTIYARPDASFTPLPYYPNLYGKKFHNYFASAQIERDFHGLGPSLEWSGAIALIGEHRGGEVAFDWGANAAVLFGRQKMRGHHHTTAHYHYYNPFQSNPQLYSRSANPHRTRFVAVPNVGGFAGLAYHVENFKLSLGYRADFFFGAMDGGIDVRKSYNRNFYGPFATISIGIGE